MKGVIIHKYVPWRARLSLPGGYGVSCVCPSPEQKIREEFGNIVWLFPPFCSLYFVISIEGFES